MLNFEVNIVIIIFIWTIILCYSSQISVSNRAKEMMIAEVMIGKFEIFDECRDISIENKC